MATWKDRPQDGLKAINTHLSAARTDLVFLMEDHGDLVVNSDGRRPPEENKFGNALADAAVAVERAMEEMDYVTRIAREALELPPVPKRKVGLEFLKDHREQQVKFAKMFAKLPDEARKRILEGKAASVQAG